MAMENEIENARRDALVKKEYEGYEKQLKKEREENEAPRKTVREALLGLGAKLMPSKPPVKEKEKSAAESIGEAARKSLPPKESGMKKASGGSVSSTSTRADGCALRGKTRGKIVGCLRLATRKRSSCGLWLRILSSPRR